MEEILGQLRAGEFRALDWTGTHLVRFPAMKRISRDPLRFDVFGIFAAHAHEQKVDIRTAEAADGFINRMRASVEAALVLRFRRRKGSAVP